MRYIPDGSVVEFGRTKTTQEFFKHMEDSKFHYGPDRKSIREYLKEFFDDPKIKKSISKGDYLSVFKAFSSNGIDSTLLVHFLYTCGIDDYPNITKEEAKRITVGEYGFPLFDEDELDRLFVED